MITVTDKASKKIKHNLDKRGKGVGIRIGVRTTGCSGLAYTMEYVDEYTAEMGVTNFAQKDFVVLVDAKSLVYLNGLTMDWVTMDSMKVLILLIQMRRIVVAVVNHLEFRHR